MPTDPYLGLKAEIAGPLYADKSDAEIVALLNAPGAPVPQPVPMLALLQYAAGQGIRASIDDASKDPSSPVRSLCLGFIDMCWGVGTTHVFDVTDPSALAFLDAFVAAGLMTADQNTAVVNLAATPGPSIAQGLGFPSVSALDLAAARLRS
jgi:hypothetical protein